MRLPFLVSLQLDKRYSISERTNLLRNLPTKVIV